MILTLEERVRVRVLSQMVAEGYAMTKAYQKELWSDEVDARINAMTPLGLLSELSSVENET